MWNKFRLWFNKNDFKILIGVIAIVGSYILIKGMNSFFKNEQQAKSNNYVVQNTSIFDNVEYKEDDLKEIADTDNDYQIVKKIEEKIINTIYIARKNNDDIQKQNLINMCSDKFIDNLTTARRTITTENILQYVDNVKDVNNYSIRKIYKYGEKNNVAKYVINLILDDGGPAIIDSYMIINIDKNNNTFSYDGMVMNTNKIYDKNEQFESIENKGSNVF